MLFGISFLLDFFGLFILSRLQILVVDPCYIHLTGRNLVLQEQKILLKSLQVPLCVLKVLFEQSFCLIQRKLNKGVGSQPQTHLLHTLVHSSLGPDGVGKQEINRKVIL